MATSDSRSATFRPRIGGRKGQIKPERVPTFRCTMIAKIEQRIRRITGGGTPRRGRRPAAGGYGSQPTALSRRCIDKARIVPMAGRGIRAARQHLSYIERDGVERDGAKGELYGADGGDFKPEYLAEELSKEAHQFRFIVGALPQPGDRSRYLVVDGKSEIEPIEGILRRKGLHDELRGDMYAVVEDAHGRAHYVPLDAAAAQRLKEGAIRCRPISCHS